MSSNHEILNDKTFRLQHFYKIINKNGGLQVLVPNKAQEHFYKNKTTRNIILKSRRLGFTTFQAITMLDNTLFTPNYRSLFISYDDPSSKKVFDDIIMLAWNNFPLKHLYKINAENAQILKLDFLNNTYSTIEVKTSGRGGRYDDIHISELGKISANNPKKEREIFAGTIPAITPRGNITIESTAEGEQGAFHDMFWEAYDRPKTIASSPKEYQSFFYNWQWDEQELSLIHTPDSQLPKEFKDYQLKHNEKCSKLATLTPITDIQITYWFYKWLECGRRWNILLENYPTTPEEAFVSSGSKLFDQFLLLKQEPYLIEPTSQRSSWDIYNEPIANHTYVIGADPSEGIGSDHSAAVIVDFSLKTPKVVATFADNNTPPDLFAYHLKNLGIIYNLALIMVERNNMGFATITKLKDIYPVEQIYKEKNESKQDTINTDKLGWHTNLSTKPRMFFDLSTAINDESLIIQSKKLYHEARIYDKGLLSKQTNDPDSTNHFDLLTALAIAYQGRADTDNTKSERCVTTVYSEEDKSDINNPL
jgi:hypothetical protein